MLNANNPKFIESLIEEPIILEPEDWGVDQWRTFLDVFGLKSAERIVLDAARVQAYGEEKSEEDLREGNRNPLDKTIRKEIFIKVQTREEEVDLLNKLHRQLLKNEDYLTDRILLTDSSIRQDRTQHEVQLTILADSKSDPEIVI